MKHCLLILLAVCLALTSCSTIDSLAVDTLMPADVSFAPDVRRIAILNNTLPPGEEADKSSFLNQTLPADGRAVCERLAEQIANANYFEQVIISDSILKNGTPGTQSVLTPQNVLNWTQDLQVDMLLVVDNATIKTKNTYLYTDDSEADPLAVMAGALSLETHIYLPGRDRPFQHFIDQDTIYWELEGLTKKQIQEDASVYLAQLPVSHITPIWETVERYYFKGGSINMRDANVALRENDWDLARQSWEAEYNSRKGKAKMRAALNLALYYEMTGDNAKAVTYLEKSLKEFEQSGKEASTEWLLTSAYLKELQQKDMDKQKLDLQMKRFRHDF